MLTGGQREKLEWTVRGVRHWIDRGGPLPTLLHERPGGGIGRGWFSHPTDRRLRQFCKKLMRHGIEVYFG